MITDNVLDTIAVRRSITIGAIIRDIVGLRFEFISTGVRNSTSLINLTIEREKGGAS